MVDASETIKMYDLICFVLTNIVLVIYKQSGSMSSDKISKTSNHKQTS